MRILVAAFFLLLPALVHADSVIYGGTGSGSVVYASTITGSGRYLSFQGIPSTAAICSGVFMSDTFTESGTGNLNLASHSPETGGIWEGPDASNGSIVVDRSTDEIKSTDSTSDQKTAFLNLTANCSNYSVTASAKTGTTGSSHRVGVMGRWLGTSNGYRFRIEGDGTARLIVVVNGVSTDLDTDTIASFSPSTYYNIELRMTGTLIQGYVNGVLECSATDSTHSANGSPGVILRNANVRITALEADYP